MNNLKTEETKGAFFFKADEMQQALAILPPGHTLQSIDYAMPRPSHIAQAVKLFSAETFIDYVREFRTESTVIFYNQSLTQFTAIFDYHGINNPQIPSSGLPNHCRHRAECALGYDPAYKRWREITGVAIDQKTLAEFLSRRADNIDAVQGVDLGRAVRSFRVAHNRTYDQALTLEDGSTQFVYEEDIRKVTTKGTVALPGEITVFAPILRGEKGFRFQVAINWALKKDRIEFALELLDREELEDRASQAVIERIRAELCSDDQPPIAMWEGNAQQ